MDATTTNNTIRARILFVDDSKLMRLSARKILAEQFDLVLAENAEQARKLLEKDPTIQLMFSDLNMPGDSGYDLLGQLRGHDDPRLRELPAIIMTGSDDQEAERCRALDLGATDFISKPFRASELMARARTHASHEEAARRLREMEQRQHNDYATGLGNRRYCIQRLDQALSFASRHRQPLTLVHLHLDGLQALVSELGEPYGSSALAKIGRVLAGSIRREDTVYRTGSETFTFLLPATNSAGAEILRDRFIPDLEALGLRPDGGALNVQSRFSIQAPSLDEKPEAAGLLERGLAGETVAMMASESPNGPAPDLEQALVLIGNGESERVRQHLGHLLQRLQPLLRLATEGGSEPQPDWQRTGHG